MYYLLVCIAVQRLGELFRKLWNPRNFKAHVSPHEMLQAVVSTSKKRFKITEQGTQKILKLHTCVLKEQENLSTLEYETLPQTPTFG